MNDKKTVILTSLIIIIAFMILQAILGNAHNILPLIISIVLAYVIIKIIFITKKETASRLRQHHIIIQILAIISLILLIFDFITLQRVFISSIPLIILVIAIFGQWFLKKEE